MNSNEKSGEGLNEKSNEKWDNQAWRWVDEVTPESTAKDALIESTRRHERTNNETAE